jgi:ABC-type branched-subunit amino acid transport system ATPase component
MARGARGGISAPMTTLSPETAPLLEAQGVQKHFGRVVALREANFHLDHNEVHAIVGDNGAGKTTLIKIISCVHRPDGGELLLDGEPVTAVQLAYKYVTGHKTGIKTHYGTGSAIVTKANVGSAKIKKYLYAP